MSLPSLVKMFHRLEAMTDSPAKSAVSLRECAVKPFHPHWFFISSNMFSQSPRSSYRCLCLVPSFGHLWRLLASALSESECRQRIVAHAKARECRALAHGGSRLCVLLCCHLEQPPADATKPRLRPAEGKMRLLLRLRLDSCLLHGHGLLRGGLCRFLRYCFLGRHVGFLSFGERKWLFCLEDSCNPCKHLVQSIVAGMRPVPRQLEIDIPTRLL